MQLRSLFSMIACSFCICASVLAQTPHLSLRTTITCPKTDALSGIAFSHDSQWLATIAGSETKVWDTHTGGLKWDLKGQPWGLRNVAFAPNGKVLATGDGGNDALPVGIGTVRLWSMADGKLIAAIKMPTQHASVQQIGFSPDSATLVTAGVDHGDGPPVLAVQMWDATSGQLKATLISPKADVEVSNPQILFSPDGKLLAVNLNNRVTLWDSHGGNQVGELAARQQDDIMDIAFSPQGDVLATACQNEGVLLWNVADRMLKSTLQAALTGLSQVRFSSDGKHLAISDEKGIALWDWQSGMPIKVLDKMGDTPAFSPDGRWIGTRAITNTGQALHLWDLSNVQTVVSVPDPHHRAFQIVFSPNSRLLATWSDDHTVKLWDIR